MRLTQMGARKPVVASIDFFIVMGPSWHSRYAGKRSRRNALAPGVKTRLS